MYCSALTLDDLLYKVLQKLVKGPFILNTSRGQTSEIIGVLLRLKNPLARLSRAESRSNLFSALGELLWYLSKENRLDFITHYLSKYDKESEDNITVYGGYGPRFFNFRGSHNQIDNVIRLLKERPSSRRAVIQIFDAEDISKNHIEIPCTCTLQFFIRNKKLNMITSMRSNDVLIGLPHDIFCFTMIQEIMANSLNCSLGDYFHSVGSLHLYKKDLRKANQYIGEGFQSTKYVMPNMPREDPWLIIENLLKIEESIREKGEIDLSSYNLNPYWSDISRLLMIYSLNKKKDITGAKKIQTEISANVYDCYIRQKLNK
jgi:thymidylate synthase